MSARRHVLLYDAPFAPLVADGRKTCTIRRRRFAMPRPGDLLDHRTWRGVPYRPGSLQDTLRLSVCTRTTPVMIEPLNGMVMLDKGPLYLTAAEIAALARRDGFPDASELFRYIARATRGKMFFGELIEWSA